MSVLLPCAVSLRRDIAGCSCFCFVCRGSFSCRGVVYSSPPVAGDERKRLAGCGHPTRSGPRSRSHESGADHHLQVRRLHQQVPHGRQRFYLDCRLWPPSALPRRRCLARDSQFHGRVCTPARARVLRVCRHHHVRRICPLFFFFCFAFLFYTRFVHALEFFFFGILWKPEALHSVAWSVPVVRVASTRSWAIVSICLPG